ncbi:hypothetical protein [Flavobacterium hydatis]|uniref:hypothetical protein n=1 Tax=Flavobacterium hydatis TaxID=991 RepID=UPI000F4F85DC|nr:hypothetical protein [Flavobacterium hydatis]
MKKNTLLAIISICILTTVNLFWFIQSTVSISLDQIAHYRLSQIIGFLEVLAYVGLLPFFVALYKKQ